MWNRRSHEPLALAGRWGFDSLKRNLNLVVLIFLLPLQYEKRQRKTN